MDFEVGRSQTLSHRGDRRLRQPVHRSAAPCPQILLEVAALDRPDTSTGGQHDRTQCGP